MANRDKAAFGTMLVDEGIISPQQLDALLREHRKSGGFLGAVVVRLGFAPEEKVLAAFSRYIDVPYVRLKDRPIDPAVLAKVQAKFASHYKIMPVELAHGILVVAMVDPLDVRQLDEIRLILNCEVRPALAAESDILEAIRRYYGVGAETLERMIAQRTSEEGAVAQEERAENLEVMAEDASIITFVNQVFTEAIRDRASDIHLEPYQNELRARFRIDGVLYDINTPESVRYFHQAIVSRIKIMAHLNIAERRLPQDGRIKIKVGDEELDLRVSILPTAFGEAVHIRILSTRFFLELEKLGLLPQDQAIIETVIKKPHGIIFVTGPTGAGKSTTLYASLARVNHAGVKVITIEDPVEYQIRGISQLQVIPQIGFSFATALRHILRHDPDIIMVGEVRDYETAEIAIRSALTGHLVFSTLHTNDAAGAVTRLLDMGVEPFLVSSSLECLVAQRLVRLICPKCKVEFKPKADMLAHLKDAEGITQGTLYEGKGCEECRFTGYRGRTGIYEILVISEPIREMILNRASSQQIRQKAISLGMRTLRQDGLDKALRGLTTITEVIRVTQQEEVPEA